MKRVILHCDLNNFYASVECMKNPAFKNQYVAVCGDVENRHGIVLAKNELAKQKGIQTGDVIWMAKQKCPQLICVPPHYHEYLYLSKLVKEIYAQYSDRVESFGIDEAWIDVSESIALFGNGEKIATIIKDEVQNKYGLSISVGVSDNKIYAKLGSEFKKPNAISVFYSEDAKQTIFHMPVESLLYVGKATKRKLNALYIYTIGHLANTPKWFLMNKLGKMGEVLHDFANGIDRSEVALFDQNTKRKSFGHGITPPRNMDNLQDVTLVLMVLCDHVAKRMRRSKMVAKCISVHLRTSDLRTISFQTQLTHPTNVGEILRKEAVHLCVTKYSFVQSLRSISISASILSKESMYHQLNMFSCDDTLQKLERCIDLIQNKYGMNSIKKLCYLLDEELTSFSPYEDHVIFPQNYFK